MLTFTVPKKDSALIKKIAKKAASLMYGSTKEDLRGIEMDLCACHANGCRLDLQKMLKADDFNLLHDIRGINRHISHDTGELMNHFLPRCAVPSESEVEK